MAGKRGVHSGRGLGFQVTGNIVKKQKINTLQSENRDLRSEVRELKTKIERLENKLFGDSPT